MIRQTRRRYLEASGSIGLTASLGVAGCLDGDDAVRFGLTPVEANVDVTDQWAALFDYLEEETGATIEPNEVTDYSTLLQGIRNDQVEIAGTPHTIAIIGDRMEVSDVVGLRRIAGSDVEFALLTTMPADDVGEIGDLRGTTISLADPLSTPGSLFPLRMLSDGGLDIGDAPQGSAEDVDLEYSDHETARRELVEREDVKAAGTGEFTTLPHVPEDEVPERVAETSITFGDAGTAEPELDLLAASEPIPRPPIISRRNWDGSIREDVERALLDAPSEAFVNEDAEVPLWFDGVVEGTIDEYDPVADVMDLVGIELEDYESE